MASAKNALISTCILLLLLLSLRSSSSSEPVVNEHSLVVAPFAMLHLSHGLPVKNSPNSTLGTSMVYERVHIHGLSRLKNLRKFAHSVMVKVSGKDSSVLPNAEVCFHRNMSLGIGMCPGNKWEKISKGSWTRSMSPFGYRLLDIRTVNSSLESFEVSIEEVFSPLRVILLALGIVMMSSASILSKSVVFYYGSTMATSVILVILVVFFQGMKMAMKLHPTGPKTSLIIYSSVVGLVSFLCYNFPKIWHSILMEAGIDEEMSYALVIFLLAFVILAGAWLGFWVVSKCILTEDGSIDRSISQLVAWSICILASLLILQSSVDPILAMEALLFGILLSTIFKRIFRLRILRRIYRNLRKSTKTKHRKSNLPNSSASEDSLDEHTYKIQSNEDSSFLAAGYQSKNLSMALLSPDHGFGGSGSNQLFISSFHSTPERRRFSKPDWEKFTRESTKNALEGLVSSPDFGKWLFKNADRITVTPPSSGRAEQ